jgi:hypothetical protein
MSEEAQIAIPRIGNRQAVSEYNVGAKRKRLRHNPGPNTEPDCIPAPTIFWRELEQEKASGAGQAADEEAQAQGAGADRKIGSPS